MLLARRGLDVLLVDRARFPSDIPHGHFIHRHGPRRLKDWGLLDRVLETNCPPVTQVHDRLRRLPADRPQPRGRRHPDGPRPAAQRARQGAARRRDRGRRRVPRGLRRAATTRPTTAASPATGGERARIVIGADGRNSALAKHVGAPLTAPAARRSRSGTSATGAASRNAASALHVRNRSASLRLPDQRRARSRSSSRWPPDRACAREGRHRGRDARGDRRRVRAWASMVRAGERVDRLYGATQLPNFVRKAYGPGWALVGDAGCHKDPFLALGVCDAFRDAELLADALDRGPRRRGPARRRARGLRAPPRRGDAAGLRRELHGRAPARAA